MNATTETETFERDNRHQRDARSILGRSGKWTCLYPGCTRRSIFSHAISESISLATIAENGHLSTVVSRRHQNMKTLQFGAIGVHDATAFNGFCEDHDLLFSVLDNCEIADTKSLLLQAYRSVISECANESRLAQLQHAGLRGVDTESVIEANVAEHPWLQTEQGRALFLAEHTKVVEAQKRRANSLSQLPKELLRAVEFIENRALEGFSVVTTERLSHYVQFRRLSFQIPVALNCILSRIKDTKWLDYYFAVIPYRNSSLVMAIVPKASEQWLLDRLDQDFFSDIAALNLVESVMACSNEWYMTPSVFAEMSSEKRKVFLQDSTCINDQRFYEDYDMTLFDSLREALAVQHPELESQLRLEKISSIPPRESFELRQERMIEAIISQPVNLLDV
jgi:hypothetical protein